MTVHFRKLLSVSFIFILHLASPWQAPPDASLLFHCWQPCLTWDAGRTPNSHGTRPGNPPGYRLLHINIPRLTGCTESRHTSRSNRPSDRHRHIRHKYRHSTHQQLDRNAVLFAWGGNVLDSLTADVFLHSVLLGSLVANFDCYHFKISSQGLFLTWIIDHWVELSPCSSYWYCSCCMISSSSSLWNIEHIANTYSSLVGHQMIYWHRTSFKWKYRMCAIVGVVSWSLFYLVWLFVIYAFMLPLFSLHCSIFEAPRRKVTYREVVAAEVELEDTVQQPELLGYSRFLRAS